MSTLYFKCQEFKTNYDIKPDVSSEEKGIDVVPCKVQ